MARRVFKLASWTGVALATSGFYLYSNKYLDPNDIGAVRVGRAVATVGVSHGGGGSEKLLVTCVQTHGSWINFGFTYCRPTCTLTFVTSP